jgi:hypothetical protein
MPRGTVVVDEKLLRDNFLRQECDGNIAGYHGARFQRGYGIGGIFKSLARYAIPLSNKVLKLLTKEHCKQPQKSVKMYSKEKMSENL